MSWARYPYHKIGGIGTITPRSIDDEPAGETLGQELLRLRKLRGISLRKLAGLLGMNAHSGLVDYERDYRIPSVDLLREYERVLAADGAVLLRLHRESLRARGARQPGWIAVPPADDRPTQIPDLMRAAAQRAKNFLYTTPLPLDAELIDQTLDEVHVLASACTRQLATWPLGDLAAVQQRTFALLAGRCVSAAALTLYRAAAIIGGLLARASLELGDPAAAMTQAHAAFACADRTEFDGLRAWVRGIQSLISYWHDRPHRAVYYAQAGAALAGRATGTVIAWLPVCEARAWARLGNAGEALRSIRRAEHTWDRVRPDDLDTVGGGCRATRPELHYFSADALSWLPDQFDAVQRHCERTAPDYRDESYPDWDTGYAACVNAVLALALIGRGAYAQADQPLAAVLALPPEARTFSVRRSVGRISDALSMSPGNRPETVELVEKLRLFTIG